MMTGRILQRIFLATLATIGLACANSASAQYEGHGGHGGYGHSSHGYGGHYHQSPGYGGWPGQGMHQHPGVVYPSQYPFAPSGQYYPVAPQSTPVWHDTTHLDYHPGSFRPHGDHYHYVPGHYDVHHTGHYHY